MVADAVRFGRISAKQFPAIRETTGEIVISSSPTTFPTLENAEPQPFPGNSLLPITGNIYCGAEKYYPHIRKPVALNSSTLVRVLTHTICSRSQFADEVSEMVDENRRWRRLDAAFWRAHHEVWKQSSLNRLEYCEAHEIPLKAFGNWGVRFKAKR
jgi:hypothetical protein